MLTIAMMMMISMFAYGFCPVAKDGPAGGYVLSIMTTTGDDDDDDESNGWLMAHVVNPDNDDDGLAVGLMNGRVYAMPPCAMSSATAPPIATDWSPRREFLTKVAS